MKPAAQERDSTADESTGDSRPGAEASLTLAFQAERPLQAPSCHSLSGASELWIGRARDETEPPGARLDLGLRDRFVSAPHLSLHKIYGRWVLRDEESRNGTFVDGAEVERCELRDGAVIEVGRSFLVFRESEGVGTLADAAEGVSTLLPVFAAQLRALAEVGPTALPVVLRGESGTGKEVVARAIHRMSKRTGAFQAINCAALAQSVAESELFGYRKGAFSGATEDRPGLIRSAEGGTLFLDEIGDLPLPLQALLLRVLQESEVVPVGGTRALPVDFRLIVATHRDLEAMASTGAFRPDLLARVQGFTLQIPPLRDRADDLGSLTAALLRRHAGPLAGEVRFSLAAARAIFQHRWPLNVRELEKALTLAITLSGGRRIDLPHLPAALAAAHSSVPAGPARMLADDPVQRREEIISLLREHHGNVAAVARVLGKARMQVHRWMRRLEINPADFR